MEACSLENIAVARYALEIGIVQVDAGDSDMHTALHLACSNDHLAIATLVDIFEANYRARD
jgi:ankyrin repeat protein